MRGQVGPLLAAVAAAALVPVVQRQVDRSVELLPGAQEALYLWRGDQVKRLLPGFEALAADVYWLRTVQYFGAQKLFSPATKFDLLKPLIEITTTLDPRLEIAYRYGAIFLCEPRPLGAGRPQEGIEILEKGVRALPSSWRLRQDLGFFQYIYGNDAQQAAVSLQEAAAVPGAPYWLETMAADILAEGGYRQKSRQMWQRMHEQSEAGTLRANAQLRLEILDAEDRADELTAQVAEFARRFGEKPKTLAELRAKGIGRGSLADSSGASFDYDSDEGKVSVSRRSALWRPRKGQGSQ